MHYKVVERAECSRRMRIPFRRMGVVQEDTYVKLSSVVKETV